jgi:hypothetical protein
MYRLWGKIMKDTIFVTDYVFELHQPNLTRKEKLNAGLDFLSLHFDIQKPMWFPDNEKDFNQFRKTRFHQDHFIETIEFDYFEVEIIEDDKKSH